MLGYGFKTYAQCPPSRRLISLPSADNPARMRFAVAADTPHNSRTSAFMVKLCVSRNFSICFHRNVALSIGTSLISSITLIASMSDALVLDTHFINHNITIGTIADRYRKKHPEKGIILATYLAWVWFNLSFKTREGCGTIAKPFMP